ncbi:MAG: phage integrase N-terminal SAM-like domain-containing protein [Anaerolineales bacterium]
MTNRKLLDRIRDSLRRKNYSYLTEQTYLGWIKRFILFHKKRHPQEMGAVELEVAPSTQNQALAALRLLYQEVLNKNRQGDFVTGGLGDCGT